MHNHAKCIMTGPVEHGKHSISYRNFHYGGNMWYNKTPPVLWGMGA